MRDHEVNCTLSQEDRKISPSVKLGVNVVNSICRMRQKRSSPHMSQVPIRPKLILADLVSVAWTIKLLPHCYCASLVRTLFIRHALPRHVFQARAPSRNSTKYRADDLCVMVAEHSLQVLKPNSPLLFLARVKVNHRSIYSPILARVCAVAMATELV